jgi:hypothetical protein
MQYHAIVDVKVGGDLILALTGCSTISGYRVSYKSKAVFRNVANITREYVWNVTEFPWDFKLTLPPIIERDCIIYTQVSQKKKNTFRLYPYRFQKREEMPYGQRKKVHRPC